MLTRLEEVSLCMDIGSLFLLGSKIDPYTQEPSPKWFLPHSSLVFPVFSSQIPRKVVARSTLILGFKFNYSI